MFYGINSPQKSLEEISDEMGLSRERVRQIRTNSIIKMQSRDNINRLRAYA
jgi:RNA polymerase primary sigma factor